MILICDNSNNILLNFC